MTPDIRPWIFAGALLGLAAQAADNPLAVTRRELPLEQNAYVLWAKAIPALQLPAEPSPKTIEPQQSSTLPWMFVSPDKNSLSEAYFHASDLEKKMPEGEGRQRLDAWLASIKEPLALVSQGITRGHFQFPPNTNYKNFKFAELSDLRHVAGVKTVVAREYAGRAEYASAAHEFAEIFKMGQLIIAGDGAEIHYVIGLACQAGGLKGMRWLCAQEGVNKPDLERLLTALPTPGVQDHALARAYTIEYAQFFVPSIQNFENVARNFGTPIPAPIAGLLNVNDTLALARPLYARLAANALTCWPDRDQRIAADAQKLVPPSKIIPNPGSFLNELAEFWGNPSWFKVFWMRLYLHQLVTRNPNILGKMMVFGARPINDKTLEGSVKIRTETNLTRAILALRIVQKETGRWPASLEACRALLPEPPLDLFAKPGTWVRYSRDRAILWSIGPNEIDNNGDPAKDVVIPLPDLAPAPAAAKSAPSAPSQRNEGT